MRRKMCLTLLLSSTLLLIGIALACTPKPTPTATPQVVTDTPTPTGTPTITPFPSNTPLPTNTPKPPAPTPTVSQKELEEIREICIERGKDGRDKQDKHLEGLMYKKQQVVVSGSPMGIENAIKSLRSRSPHVGLELKRGFSLSDGTLIQLYQKDDGSESWNLLKDGKDAWVEIVTCEINEFRQRFEWTVSADPNYHFSPAQWAGGGSPWTQNGEWAQGLFGGGLGIAPDEDFQSQWAFGSKGVNLFQRDGKCRVTTYMGRGVRIGIFDSSPFTDWGGKLVMPDFAITEEEPVFTLPLTSTRPITVTEFAVPFQELMRDEVGFCDAAENLTVWHTEPISAPNCPGGKLEHWDLSNHGLFVAGLAHAVAPASEIYLVRVLENDGCADLYSIAESIEGFVQVMRRPDQPNPHAPIVINLSLGVHEPPDPEDSGLPDAIVSFQQIIADARKSGAIVVAAAGNDSYGKVFPNEMEIPAGEAGVIGVAASNGHSGRGCFSNQGDVAASGGDGVEGDECKECCKVPSADDCRDGQHCIVGPIYKPCGPQYAYWVGTSFATPLVSGQAALLLESGVSPGGVLDWLKNTATTRIHEELVEGEIVVQEVWIPIINILNSLLTPTPAQ
jgi:subtilisin family serine protease